MTLKVFLVFFLVSFSVSQPNTSERIIGYSAFSLMAINNVILGHPFAPDTARWNTPPALDISIREKLKWSNEKKEQADFLSDIGLFGLLGASIFWSPLITDQKYADVLQIYIETTAATILITDLAKYLGGRTRPYVYFSENPKQSAENYLSFFSGHSSTSFSIAISSGMILEREHPSHSALIWSGYLTTAAITAYLRVAADKHYFTDVLTGAIIGSLSGWFITNQRIDDYLIEKPANNQPMLLQFNFSF